MLLMVSRPRELPPQPLAERYVNLSIHTAPIKQTNLPFHAANPSMSRVLNVSRSGFYEWLSRPDSSHSERDEALKAKIVKVHEENYQVYGTRRINRELAEEVSRQRIARLMLEEGLVLRPTLCSAIHPNLFSIR